MWGDIDMAWHGMAAKHPSCHPSPCLPNLVSLFLFSHTQSILMPVLLSPFIPYCTYLCTVCHMSHSIILSPLIQPMYIILCVITYLCVCLFLIYVSACLHLFSIYLPTTTYNCCDVCVCVSIMIYYTLSERCLLSLFCLQYVLYYLCVWWNRSNLCGQYSMCLILFVDILDGVVLQTFSAGVFIHTIYMPGLLRSLA